MTATMIQTSVMTVRQPAISRAVVGAFVAVALAATMLIAMVPGLARVPAPAHQPRGLDAPATSVLMERASIDSFADMAPAPQPGMHP